MARLPTLKDYYSLVQGMKLSEMILVSSKTKGEKGYITSELYFKVQKEPVWLKMVSTVIMGGIQFVRVEDKEIIDLLEVASKEGMSQITYEEG